MPICARCGQDNPQVARFCLACGAPLDLGPAPREVRKTVTVVFTDVTGSTSLGERLDPESVRHVMSRYFDQMKAVVERHGGIVEKFIGDAVMAVFGIPTLHEDDALRAVTAAAEMRDALASLSKELERDRAVAITARTGVNTGEVVAGDPSAGQRLVTGDAVNVAARLEQAAEPGEILLGDSTWRVVRDRISVAPVPPLVLKGKAEPLQAHRLLALTPGAGMARRFESPMVGRQTQLAQLQRTFDSMVADRKCHLFTVFGSAGVGKSRLVHELVSSLPPDVRVLRGRCLPYGDGITYWPLREIFEGAARIAADDPPDAARNRLDQQGWPPEITERIAQVLGLSPAAAPAEEIAWAVRRALEAMAQDHSLVVVIDDIHWAEPTMLDLFEHIVALSRDAAILLVCMARPELLDDRPGWGGGKLNAATTFLSPLSEEQSGTLIENLLGRARLEASARERIANAAGGNPLFVEQILSMLIDDGLLARTDGHWTPTGDLSWMDVPPTIQALLAARLDRLNRDEREVIECASVVGKVFYLGAINDLAPEPLRPQVPAHLTNLVRKELIAPDQAEFGQEEAYRFVHILVRDAAYEAITKATRAELHEATADWLTRRAGQRATEFVEIVAYHLEQAHRYLAELGPVDEHGRALAKRAAGMLAEAGRTASTRSDLSAAVNLMDRAIGLMSTEDPDQSTLLVDLGVATFRAGAFERSETVLAEAIERAEVQDDGRVRAHAELAVLSLRLQTDPALDLEDVKRHVRRALDVLTPLEDHLGMARAWNVLAWTEWLRLRAGARQEALEQAIEHARRAGARDQELEALYYLAWLVAGGPIPAEEGLRKLDEILERSGGDRRVESSVHFARAVLNAMRGRFDEARAAATASVTILEELGHRLDAEATRGEGFGFLELLADDLQSAEEAVRRSCETLEALGDTSYLSTQAAELAKILCAQGRFEEAEPFLQKSRDLASAEDVISQAWWREARARILVSRGQASEAVDLAREAVAMFESSDVLNFKADANVELARALEAAGRHEEAGEALDRALRMYEQKGNVVSAERVRGMVEELTAT